MIPESRKAALLEDYGISVAGQLLKTISEMKKLDIMQFVFTSLRKE